MGKAIQMKTVTRRPAANRVKPTRAKSDTVMNVRISQSVRDLIDNAASLLGKTRTDFIVETARTHAIDVLLDQRLFILNADQHAAFINALDNPPPPNEKLKQLMRRKAVWER